MIPQTLLVLRQTPVGIAILFSHRTTMRLLTPFLHTLASMTPFVVDVNNNVKHGSSFIGQHNLQIHSSKRSCRCSLFSTIRSSLSTSDFPEKRKVVRQSSTVPFQSTNASNDDHDDNDNVAAMKLATSSANHLNGMLPPLPSNMRRIYLVRHGETDWNKLGKIQGGGYDLELNQAGRIQARTVGQVLAELNSLLRNNPSSCGIQVVASSHLARAEQTATFIVNALQKQSLLTKSATISTGNEMTSLVRTSPPIRRIVSHKLSEMRFGEFEGLVVDWNGGSRGNSNDNKDEDAAEVDRYFAYEKSMSCNPEISWPGNGGESLKDVYTRGVAGIRQVIHDFPNAKHICIVAHGRFNKILLSHLLRSNENLYQGNACINVFDIHESFQQQQHDPNNNNNACTAHVLNFVDHSAGWQ